MSTSSVTQQVSDLNHTITVTMDGLRVIRGLGISEFYEALGMRRGTYFSRKRGDTDWTAVEVKRAADVLGVDVATLFYGLPHLDSNQKPAG